MADYSGNIKYAYESILGRTPSQDEIGFWNGAGMSQDQMEAYMRQSPEFTSGRGNTSGLPSGGGIGGQPNQQQQQGITPEMLAQLQQGMGGQIQQGLAPIQQGMTSGFGGVNQNLQSGFQGVNQNLQSGFQGVNQNIGQAQSDINQNTNQGLNQLNQNQNSLAQQTNQNMGQGFTGVNDSLTSGFGGMTTGFTDQKNLLNQLGGDLKSQLTNAQTSLLQGQTGIGGKLDTMGTKQDTYYGDLSTKSGNIQSSVDTMQGGLNDHYDQYGKDVTRQTQANARIEDGMAGGFQTMGNNMKSNAANVQQGIAGLASNVGGASAATPQAAQQAQTVYSNAAKGIFTQTPAQSQNDIVARQQFVTKLNMARGMAAENPAFNEFASAFDQNGRLIADSQDAQGFRIARAIDGQGNLVTARLGQDGSIQAQNALNIDQVLGQIQSSPY